MELAHGNLTFVELCISDVKLFLHGLKKTRNKRIQQFAKAVGDSWGMVSSRFWTRWTLELRWTFRKACSSEADSCYPARIVYAIASPASLNGGSTFNPVEWSDGSVDG